MHVIISLIAIVFVWWRGDWQQWRIYHPTMMYFALGNLTYNLLCTNYLLWELNPDFLSNHSLTEMLYTFIVFPATSLMFLSHYPEEGKNKKFFHYVTWISIYGGVEFIYVLTDRIIYQFGWHLGWSVLFDAIMFPMLRLFHKKPLIAYPISILIAVFWIMLFDVPVEIPIEDRK